MSVKQVIGQNGSPMMPFVHSYMNFTQYYTSSATTSLDSTFIVSTNNKYQVLPDQQKKGGPELLEVVHYCLLDIGLL